MKAKASLRIQRPRRIPSPSHMLTVSASNLRAVWEAIVNGEHNGGGTQAAEGSRFETGRGESLREFESRPPRTFQEATFREVLEYNKTDGSETERFSPSSSCRREVHARAVNPWSRCAQARPFAGSIPARR